MNFYELHDKIISKNIEKLKYFNMDWNDSNERNDYKTHKLYQQLLYYNTKLYIMQKLNDILQYYSNSRRFEIKTFYEKHHSQVELNWDEDWHKNFT